MSRRIVFIALAASAALTATPAFSDRECFEDSCRVLEATVPPPPPAVQPSAIPEFVPRETEDQLDGVAGQAVKEQPAKDARAEAPPADAAKPKPAAATLEAPAREASASAATGSTPAATPSTGSRLAPASALPTVIADPAPRQVPPQASSRAEEARVRREPARVSTIEVAKPKPAPVQAARVREPVTVAAAPAVRPARAPQPVPPPEPQGVPAIAPAIPGVAIIEVPGAVDTGEGVVTVYPNVRPDPAWKVCQIDRRDIGRRVYRCTAYSYHPYGEGGYRPYGDYRTYRTSPGYVVAPGAKIIAVNPD